MFNDYYLVLLFIHLINQFLIQTINHAIKCVKIIFFILFLFFDII